VTKILSDEKLCPTKMLSNYWTKVMKFVKVTKTLSNIYPIKVFYVYQTSD